jgi:hypothetical protein
MRTLGLRELIFAATASFVIIGGSLQAAEPTTPLPETDSSVGYDTVDAALIALRSKPGIVFTTENGWLIATDEAAYTIWSFAPKGYPAYPAVVKRQVTAQTVGSQIEMSVLCEASKQACDDLVRTFAEMNSLPLSE